MVCSGEGGQIPCLGKEEIACRAEDLMEECWDGRFPVDVEGICDYLGIAIIPVNGLREELGVEAYTAVDFKTIYVDWSGYEDEGVRYRFSVAHEVGHYILHREFFSSLVESLEEWRGLSPGCNYDYVEWQANYFAGCLLAPENELVRMLNTEYDGSFVRNCFMMGRSGLKRAVGKMRRMFKVSEQVMVRRMRDECIGADESWWCG